MSEKFVWNGNVEQTYGPEYGSQTLQSNGRLPFDRNKDLRIAAPGQVLTLQPLYDGNSSEWGTGHIIITDGTLIYDGTNADSTLSSIGSDDVASANIQLTPETSAALQLNNMGKLTLQSGVLTGNSRVNILEPRKGVYFASSSWLLSGKSHLSIAANKNSPEIQAEQALPYKDGFVLSENSKLIVDVKSLPRFAELDISIKDNAQVQINSNTLGAASPNVIAKGGAFITLYAGDTTTKSSARAIITSATPNDPVDLTGLANKEQGSSYARGFNFIGDKSTNGSSVELQFKFEDGAGGFINGGNGFGKTWLLENKLVTVNGDVREAEKKLEFSYYGSGSTMLIQFNPKA